MKAKKNVEEEIEKTLQSIEGIERATPPAFFVTQTEARLTNQLTWSGATKWIFRSTHLTISLGLVLLLNLSALLAFQNQLRVEEQQQVHELLTEDWRIDVILTD